MLTLLILSCVKLPYRPPVPPPPPPPVVTVIACEGADQVRRDRSGTELGRWSFAPMCTQVRCERHDFVRRDTNGREVERWVSAPRCVVVQPVKLTTTPGWRFGLTAS